MAEAISAFHFLRPLWLIALLPLAAALWLMWRRRLASRSWRSVVDPRLLAHLLIGENARQGPWTLFAVGLGGLLAILALAGPAWQKLEQPVFRQQSALVVLLDLSRSMGAADVKPSRLLRAQLKLRDILRQRKEGETALIVYAATPFTVSPLTSDAHTIASQLDSLSTDLMPAQGSRPDRAIGLAEKLLKQAGASHGGVLMISDGIGGTPPDALKEAVGRLVAAGHRLSVLGVGTPEGAPIPDPHGGFFKDGSGAIVLPKLDDAGLEALARQGHGAYRRLSADDSDFHALL
ncbi:MAG: VWA domain-containing protein, partial [Sulfuricellaceae bacterium]|nr:VWA domain-containing protein [Sulfuricellaceae bacterium]